MASPELEAQSSESPEAKRAKLDHVDGSPDVDDIFTAFHKDCTCMENLLEGRRLFTAREREGFCLLKIKNCNGYLPVPFSEAFCEVTRNIQDPEQTSKDMFYFRSVFEHGFNTINEFLKSPQNLPKKPGARLALEHLLKFIMSDVKDCEKALKLEKDKVSETEWAIRLAHHFLSALAANPNYALDHHKPPPQGREKCTCCGQRISGAFEDTSIGAPNVWHGVMDIIVGTNSNEVPVHVANKEDDDSDNEPDSPVGHESSFEMKLSSNYRLFYQQMISKTIVFSFLQKRFNKKDYANNLIPTIGITTGDLYIFMYDHKHDILLESTVFKLMVDVAGHNVLSMPTVLAVWLAINYKYFCSGVPDGMQELNYTADFKERVAPVFNVYQDELNYHCAPGKPNIKAVKPAEYGFLNWRIQ